MQIVVVFLLLLGVVEAQYNATSCAAENHGDICTYMKVYDRRYPHHAEFLARKHSLQTRAARHTNYPGLVLGWTSMSDKLPHELRRNLALRTGLHKRLERKHDESMLRGSRLPSYPPIDWRRYNGRKYVSAVKDQGLCGCCFAFSAAGVLEYWSVKDHPHRAVPSVSAQECMDCSSISGDNLGCDGGLMEYIFERAKTHAVPSEHQFPYQAKHKSCPRFAVPSMVKVHRYGTMSIDQMPDIEKFMEHLLHRFGPISVGVDTNNEVFLDYRDGIIRGSMCGKEIDHAVLIVGFTKDAWIVKNSWGPYWGRDGYFLLEKGTNACGVGEYVAYVSDAGPGSVSRP